MLLELETQLKWDYLAEQSITNWHLTLTYTNYAKQKGLIFMHYTESEKF